jgi:hypothetical protein
MLPEEHPFSFCRLLGLTAGERDCLFCACGFLSKTGLFLPIVFDEYLSANVDLQTIKRTKTGVSTYGYKKFDIYAIGDFSSGKSQNTFNKQERAFRECNIKTVQILAKHCAGIKALEERLLSLPNEGENIGGRDKENLGAQAVDAQNDAVLVDPADESDTVVSQSIWEVLCRMLSRWMMQRSLFKESKKTSRSTL